MFRVIGFAFWLAAVLFAGTTLTAWHTVSLPVGSDAFGHAIEKPGPWRATHYLSADCPCSQAVARHLAARGPIGDVFEKAVIIGSPNSPARAKLAEYLAAAGFHVRSIEPELAAANEGVEAVPLLQVRGPDGRVRFRGGYRDRTAPPGQYLDVAVISGLMASQPVPAPRIYGCATSSRLRRLTDPLSLKSLSLP